MRQRIGRRGRLGPVTFRIGNGFDIHRFTDDPTLDATLTYHGDAAESLRYALDAQPVTFLGGRRSRRFQSSGFVDFDSAVGFDPDGEVDRTGRRCRGAG